MISTDNTRPLALGRQQIEDQNNNPNDATAVGEPHLADQANDSSGANFSRPNDDLGLNLPPNASNIDNNNDTPHPNGINHATGDDHNNSNNRDRNLDDSDPNSKLTKNDPTPTSVRASNNQCNSKDMQQHQAHAKLQANAPGNRPPDSQAPLSFNYNQQSRCYLCDIPKQEYSLIRTFSEVICRGCLNYEGPDRVENLIKIARRSKGPVQTVNYQQSNSSSSINRVQANFKNDQSHQHEHRSASSHFNNLDQAPSQDQRQQNYNPSNKNWPIYETISPPIAYPDANRHRQHQPDSKFKNNDSSDQQTTSETILASTLSGPPAQRAPRATPPQQPVAGSRSVAGHTTSSGFQVPATNPATTTLAISPSTLATTTTTSSTTTGTTRDRLQLIPASPSPNQQVASRRMQFEPISSPPSGFQRRQVEAAIEQVASPVPLEPNSAPKVSQQAGLRQMNQPQSLIHQPPGQTQQHRLLQQHLQQNLPAVADKLAHAPTTSTPQTRFGPPAPSTLSLLDQHQPHLPAQLHHHQMPFVSSYSSDHQTLARHLTREPAPLGPTSAIEVANSQGRQPESQSVQFYQKQQHQSDTTTKEPQNNLVSQQQAPLSDLINTAAQHQLHPSHHMGDPLPNTHYIHHPPPHHYATPASNGGPPQSPSSKMLQVANSTGSTGQQPSVAQQQPAAPAPPSQPQSIHNRHLIDSSKAMAALMANLYASQYPIANIDPYHLASIRASGGPSATYCGPTYHNYHHPHHEHSMVLPGAAYDALYASGTPLGAHHLSGPQVGYTIGQGTGVPGLGQHGKKVEDVASQATIGATGQLPLPLGAQYKIGGLTGTHSYLSEQNLRRLVDGEFDFAQHLSILNPVRSYPSYGLVPESRHEVPLHPAPSSLQQANLLQRNQRDSTSPPQNSLIAQTNHHSYDQKRYLNQQGAEKLHNNSTIDQATHQPSPNEQQRSCPPSSSPTLIDIRNGIGVQGVSTRSKSSASSNFDDLIEYDRLAASPALPDGSRSNKVVSPFNAAQKTHDSSSINQNDATTNSALLEAITKDHSETSCCSRSTSGKKTSKRTEPEENLVSDTANDSISAGKTKSQRLGATKTRSTYQLTLLSTGNNNKRESTGSQPPPAGPTKRAYNQTNAAAQALKRMAYNSASMSTASAAASTAAAAASSRRYIRQTNYTTRQASLGPATAEKAPTTSTPGASSNGQLADIWNQAGDPNTATELKDPRTDKQRSCCELVIDEQNAADNQAMSMSSPSKSSPSSPLSPPTSQMTSHLTANNNINPIRDSRRLNDSQQQHRACRTHASRSSSSCNDAQPAATKPNSPAQSTSHKLNSIAGEDRRQQSNDMAKNPSTQTNRRTTNSSSTACAYKSASSSAPVPTSGPAQAGQTADKPQHRHTQASIRCLICGEHLADRHFVQCPSVVLHKFCFACSKYAIERQQMDRFHSRESDKVFCPSGKKCFLANEPTPWTFMNSEIETIFRESSRQSGSSSKSISTSSRLPPTSSASQLNSAPEPTVATSAPPSARSASASANCNGPIGPTDASGIPGSSRSSGKQHNQTSRHPHGLHQTSSTFGRTCPVEPEQGASSHQNKSAQQKAAGSTSAQSANNMLLLSKYASGDGSKDVSTNSSGGNSTKTSTNTTSTNGTSSNSIKVL